MYINDLFSLYEIAYVGYITSKYMLNKQKILELPIISVKYAMSLKYLMC